MPRAVFLCAFLIGAAVALPALAAEPNLPAGLGGTPPASLPALPKGLPGDSSPALPQGLGAGPAVPALPSGLGGSEGASQPEAESEDAVTWQEDLGLVFTGFAEIRGGARVTHDPHERQASLAEGRLHLDARLPRDHYEVTLVGDFLADALADSHRPDLDSGQGVFDLREANVVTAPLNQLDLKIGRQILTWGTGDLVFINDLFAKDWNSFFLGRDIEYLKAPSDALKASYFSELGTLDLVYAPRFNADRYVDGSRVSYFSPAAGSIVGRNAVIETEARNSWFQDDEWHARWSRAFGSVEAAVYGYRGFWKSPAGQDPVLGEATFPRLAVYGGSLLGPLAGGIAKVEVGYYDSLDDRAGDDPLVRNSEARWLLGYEREVVANLTGGLQYYAEWMQDHDAYKAGLPDPGDATAEFRHTLTGRLTYLTHNQTVTWSLFAFWSPNEKDGYLRPRVTWSLDDHASVELGGNLIWGQEDSTFLGQFQRNSNLYGALRYGF
ncbi:hypothetical protein ACTL6U_09790 [Rhodovibrionaceae bacterium A322]